MHYMQGEPNITPAMVDRAFDQHLPPYYTGYVRTVRPDELGTLLSHDMFGFFDATGELVMADSDRESLIAEILQEGKIILTLH